MISAVLVGFATWLMFPNTLPNQVIHRKPLQPKRISLLIALVIFIVFPSFLGITFAAVVYFLLPKLLKQLPTRAQQREQRALEQELDLAIDLIAAALGAGLSVLSALDAVSRVVRPKLANELIAAANRIQWGAQIDQAFTSDLNIVGSAIARAMDHGVGAGKALAEIAMRTRSQRKQILLRRAKRLSVTLALPVALLMLPGFILVGVVPMIVPAINSLL